jgi:hypothetical protein
MVGTRPWHIVPVFWGSPIYIPDTIRLVSSGPESRRKGCLSSMAQYGRTIWSVLSRNRSRSTTRRSQSTTLSSVRRLSLFPRGGSHVDDFDRRHYRQIAARSPDGIAPPESRLIPGFFGVIACPLGLLLLGLLSFENVPWILPILGSLFFGVGMVYSFTSTFTYLVE